MSLKVSFSPTIPDGTQQLVEPLLPTENLYRFIGQEIQNILREADFAEVYAETGRPGISPVVLALVTVFQFVEKLPDRQATEMAVMRLDWKYALHQPLDWQGFHYTDLCHFRQRLLKHDCEGLVFERVVTYLRDKGYVKGGGKQRTDSTHILAAVHVLSTLELLRETLKTTLQALISHNAPWTVKHLPGSFVQPHLHPASEYGLNKAEIEQALAELGREGDWLWQQVQQQGSDDLRQLPEVRLFWQVWREHFHWERGALHFSPTGHYKGSFIVSPHDVEARRGAKGSRSWIGYKAQVTEAVGQGGQASFITDLALTSAIETDNQALTAIQQRLLQRQLSPERQYVDQGYMSAENLANSQQQGINLRGYSMGNESGKPTGFRLEDFQINLEQRTATCPAGRSAKSFLDYEPTRRNHIRFRVYFGTQCRACAFFSAERCTNRRYGRVLSLHRHFTV